MNGAALKEEAARAKTSSLFKKKGWVLVQSDILGEIVVFARDGATGYPPEYVVYTYSELEKLTRKPCTKEELRALHRAKKVFGGTVETAGEAGLPSDLFPRDPRRDLREDSELWETLLALAAGHRAAQRVLLEARRKGTRLRFKDGKAVLRPQFGPGCWESKEEYLRFREAVLSPHRGEIVELLSELERRYRDGKRGGPAELQPAGEV